MWREGIFVKCLEVMLQGALAPRLRRCRPHGCWRRATTLRALGCGAAGRSGHSGAAAAQAERGGSGEAGEAGLPRRAPRPSAAPARGPAGDGGAGGVTEAGCQGYSESP